MAHNPVKMLQAFMEYITVKMLPMKLLIIKLI